ncbi:MAG: hypothetical protein NTW54_02600 [Bacteroidetes bacterium]|nr:hypothetical protein [Bacteroidota bacterium]
MYDFLLITHNIFRWIVILLAIYVLITNYQGWKKAGPFTNKNKIINTVFVGTLDLQLLIGLVLYFFYSTATKLAFANMAEAMHDKVLRFWTVEHLLGMVIAVTLAHIGSVVSKRAKTDPEKFRKAFIYFTIVIIIILLSIPFAFRGVERPLNPFEHLSN